MTPPVELRRILTQEGNDRRGPRRRLGAGLCAARASRWGTDLGARCYLTKPVDVDQLVKVVRAVGDFWLGVVRLPRS